MVDVALRQHAEIDHLGNTLVRCNRRATFSGDDAIVEKIKINKLIVMRNLRNTEL